MDEIYCYCTVAVRDKEEIDAKKCIHEGDGCFNLLTAEELKKYKDYEW